MKSRCTNALTLSQEVFYLSSERYFLKHYSELICDNYSIGIILFCASLLYVDNFNPFTTMSCIDCHMLIIYLRTLPNFDATDYGFVRRMVKILWSAKKPDKNVLLEASEQIRLITNNAIIKFIGYIVN
jgi:hypothetical protein